MVRKKKGSSLITVVIIFSVLITVGGAMLSMTLGDYKLRMTESTRIKNLYSSDSGLDVAYDILIKTFDSAAQYGANQVDIYTTTSDITSIDDAIKNIREDSSIKNKDEQIKDLEAEKDEKIDAYFKKSFNDFVYMDESQDDLSQINNSPNKDELRKCIKGKKYIQDITATQDDKRYVYVNFNTDNAISLLVNNDVEDNDQDDNEGISYTSIPVDAQREYPTRKYTIKITSRYTTQDSNGTTERKLQSIYDMTVPDYKDVVFSESNAELPKYTFMDDDKAIIVGKNMIVDNSNFSVDGNIFVQGDGYNDLDGDEATRAYDKYNGGIVLDADSSKTVTFNGDVITGKTFNIRSNVNAGINGNLYAMNVYAGNEKADDDHSNNSTLNVAAASGNGGEVVVDNDMTLKADNTDITIDKFYGINDKNIKYNDQTGINGTNKTYKPLGRTSSSIIVNGNENSNIKINTEAYIMGVAHINTTNGYSTGESTGVKYKDSKDDGMANYIAYAVPEGDEEKFKEEKFKDGLSQDDESLQLLDEDNVIKKSDHFVKYWTGKLGLDNTGGIDLPIKTADHPERNTYAIGAIVYKDSNNQPQIAGSNYSLGNIPAVVGDKQKEFASKVYNIGEETLTDSQKQSLYESLGDDKDKVSDLMNIDEVIDEYKNSNKSFFKEFDNIAEKMPDEESNNEKAIFSDKNIKIQSSNKDEIVKDGEDIIINVNSNNTLNAFIATSGNVTISGKVNFKGNIIAEGSLTISSGIDKASIQHDKELSERIQASHVDLFNSVFGHMSEDNNGTPAGGSSTSSLNVEYDLNKFLKNRLWKIIK